MRAIAFDRSIPRIALTQLCQRFWDGAVFSKISPTRLHDLPEPELPGPRGIRVRNRVCGICASDLHLLFVDIDPRVHPAALPGSDRIWLGHEVCSEVTEVGPATEGLRPGDRVLMKSRFLGPTCDSQDLSPRCRHCEAGNYCLCENRALGLGQPGVGGGWGDGYTCHESEVWKAPDGLGDDQVALIEPLACGVRAVLRRRPRAGERALVIGCGMIGLGTIAALRAIEPDATVYAAARYPHQQERARRYGAVIVDGGLFDAAEALTGARHYRGPFGNETLLGGFDVIYDCVGNDHTIGQALRLARSGGAVVLVGVHLKPVKVDLTPVWHEEVDLIGEIAHGAEDWNGQRISTFDLTADLIAQGRLDTSDLITHRFPLDQWPDAVATAVDKRSGAIRVVFDYAEAGGF
ncbi:MAG: hypothetical protein D6761_08015 [Candidatus Dadabacteria bacterium]|nr:MAG: hypothetical protein D6761_08015 [Candidatus Dadabacteria bacterium]